MLNDTSNPSLAPLFPRGYAPSANSEPPLEVIGAASVAQLGEGLECVLLKSRSGRPGWYEHPLPYSAPGLEGLAALTEGDRLAHHRTEGPGVDPACDLLERHPVRLDDEEQAPLAGLNNRHHPIGDAGADHPVKQVTTDEVKDEFDVASVFQPGVAIDVHDKASPAC